MEAPNRARRTRGTQQAQGDPVATLADRTGSVRFGSVRFGSHNGCCEAKAVKPELHSNCFASPAYVPPASDASRALLPTGLEGIGQTGAAHMAPVGCATLGGAPPLCAQGCTERREIATKTLIER
jgi:hypothetical protein